MLGKSSLTQQNNTMASTTKSSIVLCTFTYVKKALFIYKRSITSLWV